MDMDTQTVETSNPSEIPTKPAPRQSPSQQRIVLLAAYRRESARLTRFAAELKEMGIDPSEAWASDQSAD